MRRLITFFALLFVGSFTHAQYVNTKTIVPRMDITSYCTNTTNCWNNLNSTILAPVRGSMGKDAYNLWVKTDGSLWTYDFVTKAFTQVTMQYPNTKQIAVYDRGTIYRLATTGGNCAVGVNYLVQKWDLATQTWVNFTTANDCKVWLSVGRDGTLYSAILGNANGNLIYKWNGTAWAAFGTVNLLTLSVADKNNACGMGKGTSGVAKIYTQSGTNFVALANQPPGTPMGCSMGKGFADPYYTLVAWNTAQQAYYYDYPTLSWKIMYGQTVAGGTETVVARSKGITFAIGSDGKVKHWNVLTMKHTGQITGSWNGCPAQGQICNPGTLHNGTVDISFPGGLSGAAGHASLPPTTNMNISSEDFTPGCDALTGNDSGPCLPTEEYDVMCSQSGHPVGSAPPDPGCILTGLDNPETWDFAVMVTVYFDHYFFDATTCIGSDVKTACYLYDGINAWNNRTDKLIKYNFGGVVDVGACYVNTPFDGAIYTPCNPHYPYMMVTGQPDNGAYAGTILNLPQGQFGYIFVGPDIQAGPPTASTAELHTIGGHEEGHHHGLANCDPMNTQCTATAPETLMWSSYTTLQPQYPTTCDLQWAIFFEGLL